MIGANDANSPNGPIVPYLRSIDGFNTHDEAFQLAVAGGVTTAQVLPGSANAIGNDSPVASREFSAEHTFASRASFHGETSPNV